MNKTELMDITAEDSGLARDDAAKVIESMLTTVTRTLTRGGEVTIPQARPRSSWPPSWARQARTLSATAPQLSSGRSALGRSDWR